MMEARRSTSRTTLVWAAVFILFAVGIYHVSGILLPFIAALVLAYALNPSVRKLETLGVPRLLAAISMVLLLLLVIGGFLFGAVPFLKDELLRLIHNLPTYTDRAYDAILPYLERFSTWKGVASFQEKLADHIGDMFSWAVKVVVNILTGGLVLANLLSLVVITPILVFYLLRDWRTLMTNLENNLPKRYKDTILDLGREMNRSMGGYVRGQTVVCLSLATIYSLGLWLVGLEYALTVGIISGLLAFVPYVGIIVGFTVAISLALAQFSDWLHIGLVAGVYVVGQTLEGTILTPKLVGGRIGVHPVWIIFALLAGVSLFGFVGVLFALPIAAMVAVLVRAFMKAYRNSIYYKGK